MIVQYCSDLHLEFKANRKWLEDNPIIPEGDILVIAGDTFYLEKEYYDLPFLDYVSNHFDEAYILPGNHEYYSGHDLALHQSEVIEPLRKNVWLVNNCVIEKAELRLIFSTLWSKIERNILPIQQGMVDFRLIQYDNSIISIQQYNQIHKAAVNFLENELKENCKKKQLVITHHLPSELCNADEFKGSILNEAFCVDMTSFIEHSTADAWIYGHSHRNMKAFIIGNTYMLTNQLGYVDQGEHYAFKRNAILDI